jgi:hypothetical protein
MILSLTMAETGTESDDDCNTISNRIRERERLQHDLKDNFKSQRLQSGTGSDATAITNTGLCAIAEKRRRGEHGDNI